MINTQEPILIQEFTAFQQSTLFHQLKGAYLSGQIQIRDSRGLEYSFYLYLGRIIYATGGVHKVRRWRRHMSQYCSDLQIDNESLSGILSTIKSTNKTTLPWEYLLLDVWIREKKITREQLTRLTRSLVSEVLFDLSQSGKISYLIKSEVISVNPAVVIDPDQVIVGAWKMWQDWQSVQLDGCSPNITPILKKPEELKLQISPETYRVMAQYITNDHSLRELSVKLNRSLVPLTKALMVYVQLGILELQELPDLLPPEAQQNKTHSHLISNSQKFLIGCVDNSPIICETLKRIFQEAGHDCLTVNDGLQAFAIFLNCKPDLLLIDLIMPGTNGYELCAGFRQLSVFRQTPIIMLTQKANILDKMKAKMAGCNDFLSKPINSENVLDIVERYLLPV